MDCFTLLFAQTYCIMLLASQLECNNIPLYGWQWTLFMKWFELTWMFLAGVKTYYFLVRRRRFPWTLLMMKLIEALQIFSVVWLRLISRQCTGWVSKTGTILKTIKDFVHSSLHFWAGSNQSQLLIRNMRAFSKGRYLTIWPTAMAKL